MTKSNRFIAPFALLLTVLILFTSTAAKATLADDKLTEQQKARYHLLCSKLIAPCCWRQSVETHSSPAADQVRTEVVAMIENGKTDRQILDIFIKRYGQRILTEPEGITWIFLTAVPLVLFASAGLLLSRYVFTRARTLAMLIPEKPIALIPDSDWE